MTESLIWWGVQFALNFLDFTMMYFISHAMMKRHMRVEWKHVALCLIYTITLAPVLYFFDAYLFRVVSVISHLIAVKLIIKRAELNDLIIIYVVSVLVIIPVQVPLAGGIWLADQIFDIYAPFTFLLTQVISTVVIIILCRKFHWYKWFNAIQSNYMLKLIVCLTVLIILVPIAISNFEYTLSYFLILTLGFVLAGATLIPAFIKLYKDVSNIVSVKELKSSLFSLWLDMADEEDIGVFKEHFEATVNEFDVDLPTFNRIPGQGKEKSCKSVEEQK